MLSLDQAQAQIHAGIRTAAKNESVNLVDAVGRFLAEPLLARVANPAFDNSAMDGYALNYEDFQGLSDGSLPLHGEASCGDVPGRLQSGTAMRIFTGAPMPAGADTVMIQENAQVKDGRVYFSRAPRRGENVRYLGEDFEPGQTLYQTGHRINAMDISLLAANGYPCVSVFIRPRVLVVATGNELVPAGLPLQAGQIYESNKTSTIAHLQQLGAVVKDGGIVEDNESSLRKVLDQAHDFDFIITSGGASVGDHDLVKRVFQSLGNIEFWKIRIKPGKPVAFGHLADRCHFFALPGNPVSSLVTFLIIVVPALQVWNHSQVGHMALPATALNDFSRTAGRMEFLRARLTLVNGQLMAETLSGQGSHMIGTLARTNGLLRVEEDCEGFKQGDTVSVMPLSFSINK